MPKLFVNWTKTSKEINLISRERTHPIVLSLGSPYTPVTRGVEGYTRLVDMNLFLDRISGRFNSAMSVWLSVLVGLRYFYVYSSLKLGLSMRISRRLYSAETVAACIAEYRVSVSRGIVDNSDHSHVGENFKNRTKKKNRISCKVKFATVNCCLRILSIDALQLVTKLLSVRV